MKLVDTMPEGKINEAIGLDIEQRRNEALDSSHMSGEIIGEIPSSQTNSSLFSRAGYVLIFLIVDKGTDEVHAIPLIRGTCHTIDWLVSCERRVSPRATMRARTPRDRIRSHIPKMRSEQARCSFLT